jgi:cation:H+ antiporter
VLENLGLLLLGGAMLYFGAEWLVRGGAGLARAFGVSPLVVGLTVISYGTSAPELAVSMLSGLEGKPQIALGNVIGSNIANIGLILGITALIAPPKVDGSLARRELPVLVVASAALPLILLHGLAGHLVALGFVAGAVGFTYATLRWARPRAEEGEEPGGAPPGKQSRLKLAGLAALGLAVLLGGGEVFVNGAIGLAHHFGMSERVIGLTVVAIGTSLPELAASLVAALRGHSELAIGNVVGSNIFNVLLILGATGLVAPLQGNLHEMRLDLAAMLGLTLLCVWSLRRSRRLTRAEGALLTAGYAGFLLALIMLG